MTRPKSVRKHDQRKRRVRVTFTVAAILVLLAAALWVLSELKPHGCPRGPGSAPPV